MLGETIRLALKAIFRNALRSFLTVLGVVIGVAAVIAMVTVGQGSSEQVTSDVEKLGSNILMMRPGQARMGPGSGVTTAKPFAMKDVDRIAEEIEDVETAAPMASSSATVVYGNENYRTQLTATDNRYLEATEWPLVSGRQFTEAEREEFMGVQHNAQRWTFIGSGMTHANFLATLESLSPTSRGPIEQLARAFC